MLGTACRQRSLTMDDHDVNFTKQNLVARGVYAALRFDLGLHVGIAGQQFGRMDAELAEPPGMSLGFAGRDADRGIAERNAIAC